MIARLAVAIVYTSLCMALPGAASAAQVEETPIEELQEVYEDSMGLWAATEPSDAMAVLAREGMGAETLPPLDLSRRFDEWFNEMYRELASTPQ